MAAIPRPQPQRPFSTAATRVLQAGHSLSPLRWCCRRTFLYRHDDGAAGGPFSSAATMVLQRFPILGLKSRITARKMAFPGKTLHRFPSLGLKSRINARKMAFPGKTMHRFPSLGLKSRIAAQQRGYFRAFPAVIRKSGPEIKNHCSRGAILEGFLAAIPKLTP